MDRKLWKYGLGDQMRCTFCRVRFTDTDDKEGNIIPFGGFPDLHQKYAHRACLPRSSVIKPAETTNET